LKASSSRPASGASVHTDWYGWLPDAKLHAFKLYSNESETYYAMLSVSLDEAIGLRESGSLRQSFQVVDVTPALCSRLTACLQGLLSSLDVHARHYGIVPKRRPPGCREFSRHPRATLRSSQLPAQPHPLVAASAVPVQDYRAARDADGIVLRLRRRSPGPGQRRCCGQPTLMGNPRRGPL
jgi:hypothetical protein